MIFVVKRWDPVVQLHSVASESGLGLINITVPVTDFSGITMHRPAGNYTYIMNSPTERTVVKVKVIGELILYCNSFAFQSH